MIKIISFKDANKKVKKIYLNGLIQEEGEDYYLTKKGIKFINPLGRDYDNSPTIDIIRIESIEVVKIIDKK